MAIVLVTGATGFVGSRMCAELVQAGYHVRALHRAKSSLAALKDLSIELAVGDLTDKQSLLAAARGADLLFHFGALYREAKFADEVYWRVNFEGTRLALEAAQESAVRRFIHCSTTGVMGHISDPPADENRPYHPDDVYQQSKTEAEKLVLEWTRGGKIDGCVIRPTMIWGPRDTRLFKLFKGVAARSLPIVGDGATLNHYVLVDDLVRAFRLAAENARTSGQVYLVGNERIVTLQYTLECIAAVYGVKLLPFKIPALPVQLLGSFMEAICRPLGIEPPLHRRRVDFFVKSRAFDCSKAQRELGFRPTYPFEKEVEYIARWYLDNGWIKLKSAPVPAQPVRGGSVE